MMWVGNIFLYKCKLSPSVLLHVWTLYISPVLRSGLNAIPIRPPIMKTLTRFHNTMLRGILKLSRTSPLPPLYFLLGELPIEAVLHMDLLTLFWNIWANPNTKAFEILKYLLMTSNSNSLTWAVHVRLIFQLYQLPDPLLLLHNQLWPKDKWKQHTKTIITAHHESVWRSKAALNSKLSYLNTQATGLSGRMHPLLVAGDFKGLSINVDFVFHYLLLELNVSIACRYVGGEWGKQVEFLQNSEFSCKHCSPRFSSPGVYKVAFSGYGGGGEIN